MSSTEVLAIVGGFAVVLCLLKLAWKCWFLFREFVLSERWPVDLRTYGQWAVVTGATYGIGKAYAMELARRGLDVVLVSRSDDKLQAVAKEIEDLHGGQTRTIRVDFTDGNIYPTIAKELEGLEIGILVNNVGMLPSSYATYFLDIPDCEQKITQLVNCNVLSVPQMTRLILPQMVERGAGLIINISSESSIHPLPSLSLYSSSKVFVTNFSKCLHAQYKSKGIIVQCVCPFLVSSNMTHNLETSCIVKSASAYAREALNTVGYSSFTSGCRSHALQSLAVSVLMPEWLLMSSYMHRKVIAFRPFEKSEEQGGACSDKEKLGKKEA